MTKVTGLYLDKQNELAEKLEKIQSMLDSRNNETKEIHYGHLGDLNHVGNELDKLIAWIK